MALTMKDLCSLAQINTEDDENQHIAEILKEPIDRKTTGEAFAKLVGYDPTIIFDEIEMTKILDEFIKSHGNDDLKANKRCIITEAMDDINSNRSTYQITALEAAIRDIMDDNGTTASIFEEWSKKHYSAKVMYDPDYDEDDSFDDDDGDSDETVTIGNDSSEYTSDDDEDDENDFDDDDEE